MKKLTCTCVFAFGLAAISLTGCSEPQSTVTTPPENAVPTSELPSQQGYEAAMQAQEKESRGN